MGGAGRLVAALAAVLLIAAAAHAQQLMVSIPLPPEPDSRANMEREFPDTDFSRRTIDLTEIINDGNFRDLISAIDAPRFQPLSAVRVVGNLEPVLSLAINGDARAYPLRILLFHEIVHDVVGGVPVLVSYCPLCNSGVVYRRTLDGRVLEFANTGRLRHHDMVMYDRATESWWQQFTGEAIIGELAGRTLGFGAGTTRVAGPLSCPRAQRQVDGAQRRDAPALRPVAV